MIAFILSASFAGGLAAALFGNSGIRRPEVAKSLMLQRFRRFSGENVFSFRERRGEGWSVGKNGAEALRHRHRRLPIERGRSVPGVVAGIRRAPSPALSPEAGERSPNDAARTLLTFLSFEAGVSFEAGERSSNDVARIRLMFLSPVRGRGAVRGRGRGRR